MTNFTPTIEQENVSNFFMTRLEEKAYTSIFLNAVAGSGKTSTIMLIIEMMEKHLTRSVNACSLSFNVNIRDASQKKLNDMGSNVKAKTTNQLGRSILVNAAKKGLCKEPGKLDTKKYRNIVDGLMSGHMNDKYYFQDYKEYSKAVTAVITLIDAVRSTRTTATMKNIIMLVAHYNLQEKVDIMSNWFELAVTTVEKAIQEGINQYNKTGIHDFNDQICLPIELDVTSPDWAVMFVDEAQDLNRARLDLILHCIEPNGVLFFVGDPSQSIQGFTFSDTEAVQTIKEVTGAVEFPLSVCWRCDTNIVQLAKTLVPHIQAKAGIDTNPLHNIVEKIAESGYIDMLQSGTKDADPDLVLSRVKAPLMSDCLSAIRAGKSAIVRGRDIGSSIVSFLEDATAKAFMSDFDTLLAACSQYTDKKISRLNPDKDELKIDELSDQYDTIEALVDGYKLAYSDALDLQGFKAFIESKFSDTTDADEFGVKPIVFSTIHKAKGLEYNRVFIIETSKLPHPAAKPGWQIVQEYNILYVAITRAKHALYFVGSVPAALQDAYNLINGIETVTVTEIVEEETAAALETLPETAESLEVTPVAKVRRPRTKQGNTEQAYFRADPAMKQAVNEFVTSLQDEKETGGFDFKELIPFAGNKLAFNDIIIAALLSYEPFMTFFQASPQYAAYQGYKPASAVPGDDSTPPDAAAQESPALEEDENEYEQRMEREAALVKAR